MNCNATSLETKVRTARHWCVFLREHNPEYFFTLTFRYEYDDVKSEQAMRAFVRMIVSGLPRMARETFAGVVLAERTTGSGKEGFKFDDCYHFHFVVWGLDGNMTKAGKWLKRNVIKASAKLYPRIASPRCTCKETELAKAPKTCRGGMSCRGPRMSGRKWVNCQQVQPEPEDLFEYMTSDLYRYERPTGAQLLPLGKDGVNGYLENCN